MPEWVRIVHPLVPNSKNEELLVTEEAFELTHKALGWELYKPPKETKPVSKEK